MAEPATKDEFNAKAILNYKVEGFGPGVTVHLPCPFCAEPDFKIGALLEYITEMKKGAICASCGRGAKVLITKVGGVDTVEYVQISGPDPQPYIQMRRV